MSMKKEIKDFGKPFQYLQDDALRLRETGNATLTVSNASFRDSEFHGQTWRRLQFIDCDFDGGYRIRLEAMENVEFRNCRFSGVIEFGVMTNVRFHNCSSGGNSNWGGQALSLIHI